MATAIKVSTGLTDTPAEPGNRLDVVITGGFIVVVVCAWFAVVDMPEELVTDPVVVVDDDAELVAVVSGR